MKWLFSGCSSLSFLPDISKWDTSKVNTMMGMFDNCHSLVYLSDISKWNISNVYTASSIYDNFINLINKDSLEQIQAKIKNKS